MRRRDLAWIWVAGRALEAQTAPAATSASEDFAAAKERIKGNSDSLKKFAIPMATEPAFAFKA